MFGHKKQTSTTTLFQQLEKGEITYEQAAQQVDLRKLIASLEDAEHTAKDHGNLVDLRNTWGRVILFVLLLTIFGDFFLVWMVGTETWAFKDNSQFLMVVATEHVAQILGLVLVVLKSLFPKGKTE